MVIQDFPDLLDYCNAKIRRAGDTQSFIKSFCDACLRASPDNFEHLLMPLEHFSKTMPALAADMERERRDRDA